MTKAKQYDSVEQQVAALVAKELLGASAPYGSAIQCGIKYGMHPDVFKRWAARTPGINKYKLGALTRYKFSEIDAAIAKTGVAASIPGLPRGKVA